MLWKRASALLFAALAWPVAALAQLPPASGIVINATPVQGGTASQCLYVTSTGKVGQQACGSGSAASVTIGTTTITSGTTSRLLYDNAGVIGEALLRYSAANLFLGDIDAAAPVSQTLSVQNVVAGTTDASGPTFVFKGSAGTGTGNGGSFLFQVALPSTTGSTQNAYSNILSMSGTHGGIGLGVSASSSSNVIISKNITGAVTSYGVRNDGQVQSGVTTRANYFHSNASTQATSFSTTIAHYNAIQGTFGAGSTVTNQYGFFAASTLTGATNNYGFYSDIASTAARFNFYANGTADNFFNGKLTVMGSTAIPAGGTAGSGYNFSSTANFGIYFGSGAPSLSAAKGSLYLRSDGSARLIALTSIRMAVLPGLPSRPPADRRCRKISPLLRPELAVRADRASPWRDQPDDGSALRG